MLRAKKQQSVLFEFKTQYPDQASITRHFSSESSMTHIQLQEIQAVRFILSSIISFRAVENPKLKNLIELCYPSGRLPTLNTLAGPTLISFVQMRKEIYKIFTPVVLLFI